MMLEESTQSVSHASPSYLWRMVAPMCRLVVVLRQVVWVVVRSVAIKVMDDLSFQHRVVWMGSVPCDVVRRAAAVVAVSRVGDPSAFPIWMGVTTKTYSALDFIGHAAGRLVSACTRTVNRGWGFLCPDPSEDRPADGTCLGCCHRLHYSME